MEKSIRKHTAKGSSDLTFSGMLSDGENDHHRLKKTPVYGKSKFVRAISNFASSLKKNLLFLIFLIDDLLSESTINNPAKSKNYL